MNGSTDFGLSSSDWKVWIKLMILCRFAAPLLLLNLALTACSDGPATAAAPAPQDVSVVTLEASPRPYVRELPGRIAPTRIAEVRARVPGIVISRSFEQGSEVRAGEVLYHLDPAHYEVELNAAEAALAKTIAVLEQETKNAQRQETLVATRA